MSLGIKMIAVVATSAILLIGTAVAFKRYAPGYDYLFSVVLSVVALTISMISTFKNELFEFEVHVVPAELTIAPATEGSHKSLAIVYSLLFSNSGYGQGVVEWVALKIRGDDGPKLYVPIAELDQERYLQGRRAPHADNIREAFAPFLIGSKEATKHFILFSQEENNTKYPFKEWLPGKYQFEVWIKTSQQKRAHLINTQEFKITQETIDNSFRGTGTLFMTQRIELD
jgi:hypothetical protein